MNRLKYYQLVIKLNRLLYNQRSIKSASQLVKHLPSMLNKKLLKLSLSAIFFGSIYTIFRKYQSCAQLSDPDKTFNQPLIQSFFIFVGMSTMGLFKPWLKQNQYEKVTPNQSDEETKSNGSIYVFILPSLLDVAGTIVDTAGLFYTSVSVSQMLKGSVIFFTYLITLFYLGKKLSMKRHILMVVILLSLFIIGASNIQNRDERYQSQPLLGNILIILSQLLFSFMFIVEEKLLKNNKVDVIDAVAWEGIWGALFSAVLLLFFSNTHNNVVKCDFLESCSLIYSNPNLLIAILCTFLAIGPFNYFGMSITKQASALHRCLVCTFRMVVVWVASLVAGWQEFSFVQLIGYIILTYAIYQFNQAQNDQLPTNVETQQKKCIQLFDNNQSNQLQVQQN